MKKKLTPNDSNESSHRKIPKRPKLHDPPNEKKCYITSTNPILPLEKYAPMRSNVLRKYLFRLRMSTKEKKTTI